MKKNFMSIAASVAIVSAAVLFTGCGDSDSSSGSSGSSGSLVGVLDPMAGVAYNTSSGVSGTTNGTGHFTFNSGDKVTFSIGALKFTTNGNLTQPGYVVNPDADGEVIPTNTTLMSNLVLLRQVIAGSLGAHKFVFSSGVVSALGTNLANTTAAINAVVPQLSPKQLVALASTLNVTDPSDTNQIGDVNLTAKASAAVNSAFTANVASFNSTGATNKVVWLGGSAYPITDANATGAITAGSAYQVGGALTAGTPVLLANNSQQTIQAVMYNLTTLGFGAGSFSANKTITIGVDGAPTQNETITFYTNGTFSANNSGTVYVGDYSVRADGLGIDMIPTTSGYENRTVTFEDDPRSTGVVAQYWTKFTTSLTAAITAVLNGVKQVVTALS